MTGMIIEAHKYLIQSDAERSWLMSISISIDIYIGISICFYIGIEICIDIGARISG